MKKTENRMAKGVSNRGRPSKAAEIAGEDVDVRCNRCGKETKVRVERVLTDGQRVVCCQKCGLRRALSEDRLRALLASKPPRILR